MSLEAIAAELTVQNPSPEMALLLKKQRRIEKLGVYSLSISGIIALCLLLAIGLYYKLQFFGPELIFGSAIGAMVLFLLGSIFLLGYSKYFMKSGKTDELFREQKVLKTPTNKLLNDPPFQPASVTEHSTELLKRK